MAAVTEFGAVLEAGPARRPTMSTSEPVTSDVRANHWRVRVENFRALELVDWSPSDVCLLGGPNGSGKSTILNALQFPRLLINNDLSTAIRHLHGATSLRRLGAADNAPVAFEFTEGDVNWRVELPIEGLGIHPYYGERLTHGSVVEYEARPYESTVQIRGQMQPRHERRCGLASLWRSDARNWLRPFVDRLTRIRIHYSYTMSEVRQPSPEGSDDHLIPTGSNLWAVLKNWGDSDDTETRARLEWVLEHARRAFPDIISDLRFDGLDGLPRLYMPGHEEQGIPVHLAADGLLVGLMHLTAVAGAMPRMVLACDEMEHQLHPHAIREILSAMRARADEQALTVILTTHSPVLMNEFKGHEDAFYIIEHTGPGAAVPVPLPQVKDPKWLRHFALGDLYDREEFASPSRGAHPDLHAP